MRLGRVPEGGGGDVVPRRQIAAARAPPERLDGGREVLLEADGIEEVPAVEAEARVRLVGAVGTDHVRNAGVGGGELLILLRLLVHISFY